MVIKKKLLGVRFNVYGSVHRNNIPLYICNKMQSYTVYFICVTLHRVGYILE
jgi:hypothetical protein